MSFQIALDKYERAYGALVRAVQAALQATFAEESNDRGLTQADLSRELGISPSVISRKLNGSGNATLRSISDLFTAMGREPLSSFHPPPGKYEGTSYAMPVLGSANFPTISFSSPQPVGLNIACSAIPVDMINANNVQQVFTSGSFMATPLLSTYSYDLKTGQLDPCGGNV
jgi:transcriptional regulator with XRE-family HTH domain